MSISSVSNKWLNRLYKTIAILLVMVAVLISAFRLLLPYVENYRSDLQNYVNSRNGTDIQIGSLSMTWQRFGPSLVAKDVILLETEQASVSIQELETKIDFWGSLSKQRLVTSNLIITGAKVNVEQALWQNNDEVDTSTTSATANQDENFDGIVNLFLNRLNEFSILNSQIVVRNKQLSRKFHINTLNWLNSGDIHQAQGSVVVNGLSSNNIQLKISLHGDQSDELSGQLYLQANHLDITPWLDSVLAIDNDKTKSDISFAAWLNVTDSAIDRLQVELPENSIHWQVEQESQSLKLGQGQLLLVKGREAKSFKLFSTPLSLQFNEQPEHKLKVMLSKKASDFSAYLSAIDLAFVGQLSPLFTNEPEQRKMLAQLALAGQLNDTYINYIDGDLQFLADFNQVSNAYSNGIPGMSNLSGKLSYNQQQLFVAVSGENGALDFSDIFVAPIQYQSLSSKLDIAFNEQGWQLSVDALDIVSTELSFAAQVKVDSPAEGETTMALLADITRGNAALAGHYYPLNLMSDDLVGYLNDALVSGNIEQAAVLVNGPLSHFPFTDGSGIFVVDAELTDSTFKFASDWPAITQFDANLNFTNNSMLITGRAGELSGLDVTGVRAAIDDLGNEQVLTVAADIKPSGANLVHDLMLASPLKDSVGSVLEQLQIAGDVSGKFDLNLPLNDAEQVLASGVIDFADNNVALQAPRMDFSKVNGSLTFANDKISTQDLQLTWHDLPLALVVNGINKEAYYDTDIQITANWQANDWQAHVPPLLKKYADGELPWQGALSLHQHHQGGFSYQFDLTSQFENTQLNLPAPYGKTPEQAKPFQVEVSGQLAQSKITAELGDDLSFFGILDHESTSFSRAHLVLGNEEMLLPMDGFHITTKLDRADFAYWQPLLSDIIDTVSQPSTTSAALSNNSQPTLDKPLFAKPERIRGTIENMEIFGQQLSNISFNLFDKTDWWLLQLNATETRSQLKFYPDWHEQGVDINAEFIHLTSQDLSSDETQSDSATNLKPDVDNKVVFANIPPLRLHCDRCQIDALDFGKIDLVIERINDEKIQIKQFNAQREQAKLAFTGDWHMNAQSSTTSLQGDVSVDNIEYELNQLGYESIIRDSGGKLDFNLNWQGGPHDFDVKGLYGAFNVRIDDGYLADVSDKARIFSILSLQSLVRKLTLDFRDIFSDGMFYSDIKGEYHIEQGILYTDRTKMNGTAGNLDMTGSTDLSTGLLDYKMSYKPNLTSSLPVLAWIATLNPVTFLAGVAIDQVIKSQVVSEFKFELTGSVSDPNFQQVERKTKEVRVGRSKTPEILDDNQQGDKKESPKKSHLQQYEGAIEADKPSEPLLDGATLLTMPEEQVNHG